MDIIYKKLKKAAATQIISGVVFILVGVFTGYIFNMDLVSYLTASQSVFEIPVENLDKDAYYTCDNNILWDYYAESDEGRYYITYSENAQGETVYMGFFVFNRDVERAEEIVEQTWKLMDNEIDTADIYLSGRGYVYEMDEDEAGFFDDYFTEGGVVYDKLCHKTFVLLPLTECLTADFAGPVLIPGCFILIGLIFIICYFAGSYKKRVKKAMRENNISEMELTADVLNGVHLDNVDIGKKYLLCYDGGGYLIPYDTLVWAYVNELKTKHMLYGIIPTGTTTSYSIMFYDNKGKHVQYAVKKVEKGHEILEQVSKAAPYILLGFHEELKHMQENNFAQMVQTVKERKMQYDAGNAAFEMQTADMYSQEPMDPYFG